VKPTIRRFRRSPRTPSRAATWLSSSRIEPPPHPIPRDRGSPLGSPRFVTGKMLLTDFCNRISRYEHLLERSTPEVKRADFRPPAARPLEPRPQRTTRVAQHLTMRRQLRCISSRPRSSSDERTSAARSWRASRSKESLARRSSVRAFSAAHVEKRRTSDAPCRGPRFPRLSPGIAPPARTDATAPSSKDADCSARSAFPRRVPARPLRSREPTSNADPPPFFELCRPNQASDTPSPLASVEGWARPRRYRELFAFGRSTPRAARRLLQSKRSTSTTFGSSEPFRVARTANFRPQRDRAIGPIRPFGRMGSSR
jgi:hypothetical protein